MNKSELMTWRVAAATIRVCESAESPLDAGPACTYMLQDQDEGSKEDDACGGKDPQVVWLDEDQRIPAGRRAAQKVAAVEHGDQNNLRKLSCQLTCFCDTAKARAIKIRTGNHPVRFSDS